MKSKITLQVLLTWLTASIVTVGLLVLFAVTVYPQNPKPTPTAQKGKAPRPVLKQRDPKAKTRKPADPETCLYFVVTSRLDEQMQALVSASTFKALSENFGENIVVVMNPSQVPVGTPKQRVHIVNLTITMGRLSDIQVDSLSQGIQRDISGPLIAAGKQKIESKSKIPGIGDALGRIGRQATRGANIDGQDVVFQYWWTINYQVDGLTSQPESFFWQVVRHRVDEYANQYCFTVVGLGDSFTTIKPYHNDIGSNFLGCEYEAVQPGLYQLTLMELWGRQLLSGWLNSIPKPPAARTVGEVISEQEVNENCNEQEYDSALKRYKCVAPKVQAPCQRRRLNPDGTFTCLDAGLTEEVKPKPVVISQTPPGRSCIVCNDAGGSGRSRSTPTPTPVLTPTPKPQPPPANAPVLKPEPNAPEPNLGHTSRIAGFAGFTPSTDVSEGSEGAKRVLGFFCVGSGDAWFTSQWKQGWAFRINGPMMVKVIGDFQSQNGLTATGQLDVPTRALLDKIWKQNHNLFPDMSQLASKPAPCLVK